MNLTAEQINTLAAWQAADVKLRKCKKDESSLRDEVVQLFFETQDEGAKKVQTSERFTLKAVFKNNKSIDEKELKLALKKLPKGMKKKLIKTKSSLITKGYEELSRQEKEIFDECLTIKPAKPSLQIIETTFSVSRTSHMWQQRFSRS